jgi:hypothetical protein
MHPNSIKCIINQTHKIFFPFCLRSIRVEAMDEEKARQRFVNVDMVEIYIFERYDLHCWKVQ